MTHSDRVPSQSNQDEKMFYLSIVSDPKYLRVARMAVKGFLVVAGYQKKDTMLIVLAVDEAVTNVMKYGYENRVDQPIELRLYDEETHIRIVIRDYGKKGDPSTFKSRDLEDVRPGGLGVFLMNKIMNDLFWDVSLPEGTELTMIKNKS